MKSCILQWLAPVLFIGALGLAVQAADNDSTHEGKLVSIAGDKLTMTNTQRKEHSHTLAADVKVTCDGKVCTTAELKAGMKIRVTTTGDDQQVATRIEALDKHTAFAGNRHEGRFVSLTADRLTMTDKEGKQHSHPLAADAVLTLDGKACQAANLKPDTRIRVTTTGAEPRIVTRIEALDKNTAFASDSHDGMVVSVSGTKLVMTDDEGKAEQTCTLTADTKVTCDGKVCKSSDLKPGMRIRVTTHEDDPHAATRIEAIEENPGFENGTVAT